MSLHYSTTFRLSAGFGHRDVTDEVRSWVAASGVTCGAVVLQLVGSTGGLTTIEYEPGALADLERAFEALAPASGQYAHNERWGDGNGFSHLRSAMLRTSLSIPILDGQPALGTWQQIVALNFDNRDRERTLVAVVVAAD